VAVVVGALVLWRATDLVIVAFASVLLAVALRTVADRLVRHARLPRQASLAAAVALLAGLLVLGFWLIGDTLATQLNELVRQLPDATEKARTWLGGHAAGRWVLDSIGNIDGVQSVSKLAGAAITTLGALGNAFLILVLGVYLAVDPGLYRRGALYLVPRRHRAEADRALRSAGEALRRWLAGQAIAMAVVGVVTGVGLWALGVPFALSLGVIAGLLEFVAFIGPIVAAIPAVLVAFGESPMTALYVALLFFAVQQIEGYLLMPLVQRWTVELPPALAIFSVVLLGVLIGLPGVIFGIPLVVAALAIAKSLREREHAAGRG
jgi:predicted PurR-regulated permease PerM